MEHGNCYSVREEEAPIQSNEKPRELESLRKPAHHALASFIYAGRGVRRVSEGGMVLLAGATEGEYD